MPSFPSLLPSPCYQEQHQERVCSSVAPGWSPMSAWQCQERELQAGLWQGSSAGAHLPRHLGCAHSQHSSVLGHMPGCHPPCRGGCGQHIPPAFLHPARGVPASLLSSQPAWGLQGVLRLRAPSSSAGGWVLPGRGTPWHRVPGFLSFLSGIE